MLSLEEISDRLEIQQLLVGLLRGDRPTPSSTSSTRYSPPDAYIDYRDTGGIDGQLPAGQGVVGRDVLPNFPAYAHMLGNFDVTLAGDTATARTICFNPMVLNGEQKPRSCSVGVWYDDEFVRTADGWRHDPPRRDKCFDKILTTERPGPRPHDCRRGSHATRLFWHNGRLSAARLRPARRSHT